MDENDSADPVPELELVSWETAATFANAWEAELARARLETEGIRAIVADAHLGSLISWNVVGGVKVRVAPEEREHAVRVLAEQRPAPEIFLVTDDELGLRRCPECNSDNLQEETAWLQASRWQCRSCGGLLPEEVTVEQEDENQDLVSVARFATPWEAHLARMRLESEGIQACVLEERLPPIDLLTGRPQALNRVAVRSRDAREAEAILAEPEEETAEEEDAAAE